MEHWILFTGHMIDSDDRPEPRFPAEKEKVVKEKISEYIKREKEIAKGELKGIAGGACGGDILFHELCQENHILTEMYLALPVEEFKHESVAFAGKNWVLRFEQLKEKIPVHILPKAKGNQQNSNVWECANLWMLETAFKNGGKNTTLIALWDRKGGDGKGGTEHMLQVAGQRGAKLDIIDINKL